MLLPFRIALTGSGGGPSMFEFTEYIGKEATLDRLKSGINKVAEIKAKQTNGRIEVNDCAYSHHGCMAQETKLAAITK